MKNTIICTALLCLAVAALGQSTKKKSLHKPLISKIFTADASAHVFGGKVYIYPSHDIESGKKEDDEGGHFDMRDYHVLSMEKMTGKAKDHGTALDIKDIPWAGRQLWAPDAAHKNGVYYLYFPVKDKSDVFRIGVATSASPTGPFKADPEPIKGSYSIDPCVFQDNDSTYYMYFGGIWGGQLQRWDNNEYDPKGALHSGDQFAIQPRMVKLSPDMKSFAEEVREVKLVSEKGLPFLEKDNDKRFFEASWMHKYNGKYYFSYSTGDTHNICYAIGDSPYGPFRYKGIILKPVTGWTSHHSIVEVSGKWYLFYHDVQISGKTHLRNIKVTALKYNDDGTIPTIEVYK